MTEKRQNVHEGHRNRLRGKFARAGLDNFEEHEVLEMMLFDCVPRKDTNKLAHELIAHYGSLWQVVEAHPEELACFKDMTYPAACSLSQQGKLQKYLDLSRVKNAVKFTGLDMVHGYFRSLLGAARREEFYVLCLDAGYNFLYKSKLREGTVNRVNIEIREIADVVCRHNATSVVVGHSHPSGDAAPSVADVDFTRKLFIAAQLLSIHLIDHVVVAGDKLFSFYQGGYFDEYWKDYALGTKTPYSGLSVMLAQNKPLYDFYHANNNRKEEDYGYQTI